jgi:Zn-finger nucleic acid-binding protein
VRCATCGADNVVPDPGAVPVAHDPYRDAAPHPSPAGDAAPPQPARSHELGPLCPRCTRLVHEDPERAALACDRCRGLFVDHASLAARVDAERPRELGAGPAAHATRAGAPEDRVRYARCPLCNDVMTRMNFGTRSGIVVDVCPAHGTWFDGGELDAALEFVRAGGLEADLEKLPAPPADASARAMEAMLTVELIHQQQHQQQEVNDVVRLLYLTMGYRRW